MNPSSRLPDDIALYSDEQKEFVTLHDVAKEGGVVKGKDDVHGAVRPHLDTPFSNLVHYVLVMPTKELGNAAYGWPVHLALAGKGAVSGGALDWPAVKVAVGSAVPDDTPGPWLKLILPYDPGGYRGGGCVPALIASAALSARASQLET